MAKITKRVVDALKASGKADVFAWDSELKGFGVRVKPSGTKSFLIQYRNPEGRTRRLVLGQYGALTPEGARDIARRKLAAVADGEDPSEERHAARAGMTVAEVCDWYLTEAAACRILGRSRRPIKAATLKMDRSRIDTHVRPIIGHRLVVGLTRRDIENLQADIAAGRSAAKQKGRGGRTTGGIGVASRTISTLRSLLGHAEHSGVIPSNPAQGVRQLATESRKRRLTIDDLERLGRAMRDAAAEEEHPVGLGAIRVMLLTGFRRMEVLGLKRAWCSRRDHCVRFPDTKSGAQVRVIGSTAIDAIEQVPQHAGSPFVFPADWGDGHFIGVVRVLDRVCARAGLEGVTPHVLRHTFASVAGDLGFSELTIAGLLGHSPRGVTQGYIHLDTALVTAAEKVAMEIATVLNAGTGNQRRRVQPLRLEAA